MPIKEEIYIIISLIIYGIYLISSYDLISQIQTFNKQKKIKSYLIEIIFNILQILITIKFSQNLSDGYIPAYFIIFLIIGILIYYYTSRKFFLKEINKFLNIYKKNEKKLNNFINELFYSKEMIKLLKKELKRYKKIFTKKR